MLQQEQLNKINVLLIIPIGIHIPKINPKLLEVGFGFGVGFEPSLVSSVYDNIFICAIFPEENKFCRPDNWLDDPLELDVYVVDNVPEILVEFPT